MGQIEGEHYITMDYIEGKTYAEQVDATRELRRQGRRRGYADLRAEVGWLLEVAAAVEHAHEQRLIHRDLKPGNIMIGRDDRAYVMDFGLAKQLREQGEMAIAGSKRSLTVRSARPARTWSGG